MFADLASVVYGVRAHGRWSTNTIVMSAEAALGQLVEFALDGRRRPHATFFEVASTDGPPMGDIVYATVTN